MDYDKWTATWLESVAWNTHEHHSELKFNKLYAGCEPWGLTKTTRNNDWLVPYHFCSDGLPGDKTWVHHHTHTPEANALSWAGNSPVFHNQKSTRLWGPLPKWWLGYFTDRHAATWWLTTPTCLGMAIKWEHSGLLWKAVLHLHNNAWLYSTMAN